MKHLFVSTMFLLLFVNSNAQNWNFITANERYHFQHKNDTIPLYTILIDSVLNQDKTTTNYLNRLFLPCDTCSEEGYYLDNQPSFLQREFVYPQDSSTVVLQNPEEFTINLPGAGHNEWWFDKNETKKAALDTIVYKDVFGKADSVVLISINNEPEIEISKTYGLLKYFEYTLSGLENAELGNCLPGFKEFYNFEVGDVFMYRTYGFNSIIGYDDEFFKYEVLERKIYEDSIEVVFDVKMKHNFYVINGILNNYVVKEVFRNTKNHLANTYPNQLIQLDYYSNDINFIENPIVYDDNPFTYVRMHSENAITEKRIGYSYSFDYDYSFVRIDSFLFKKSENDLMECMWKFKEGVGLTDFYWTNFENADYKNLIGYIKNGISYGRVLSDEFMLSQKGIEKMLLEVFPNPSMGAIIFKFDSKQKAIAHIYTVDGKFIETLKVETNHLYNLDHLNNGTYIVKLQFKDRNEYVQWIKQ